MPTALRDLVEEAAAANRLFDRAGRLSRRAEEILERSGARLERRTRKRYWRTRHRVATALLPEADLAALMAHERPRWGRMQQRLAASGALTAVGSPYRGLLNPAGLMWASSAAVTGTTIALLWPMSTATSPMTTIAANGLYSGQILKVTAFGIATTAASSQGNITATPLWGTTTGGTSLGASPATALTASLTNVPWFLEWLVFTRAVVNAASGSTLVCGGNIAMPTNLSVPFGGTVVATIDTTTAQGLAMGVTLGSASDSMTTQFVMLETIN